jgi:hypothetical protein
MSKTFLAAGLFAVALCVSEGCAPKERQKPVSWGSEEGGKGSEGEGLSGEGGGSRSGGGGRGGAGSEGRAGSGGTSTGTKPGGTAGAGGGDSGSGRGGDIGGSGSAGGDTQGTAPAGSGAAGAAGEGGSAQRGRDGGAGAGGAGGLTGPGFDGALPGEESGTGGSSGRKEPPEAAVWKGLWEGHLKYWAWCQAAYYECPGMRDGLIYEAEAVISLRIDTFIIDPSREGWALVSGRAACSVCLVEGGFEGQILLENAFSMSPYAIFTGSGAGVDAFGGTKAISLKTRRTEKNGLEGTILFEDSSGQEACGYFEHTNPCEWFGSAGGSHEPCGMPPGGISGLAVRFVRKP